MVPDNPPAMLVAVVAEATDPLMFPVRFPTKDVAVIVLAEKLPLESRATIELLVAAELTSRHDVAPDAPDCKT